MNSINDHDNLVKQKLKEINISKKIIEIRYNINYYRQRSVSLPIIKI